MIQTIVCIVRMYNAVLCKIIENLTKVHLAQYRFYDKILENISKVAGWSWYKHKTTPMREFFYLY